MNMDPALNKSLIYLLMFRGLFRRDNRMYAIVGSILPRLHTATVVINSFNYTYV